MPDIPFYFWPLIMWAGAPLQAIAGALAFLGMTVWLARRHRLGWGIAAAFVGSVLVPFAIVSGLADGVRFWVAVFLFALAIVVGSFVRGQRLPRAHFLDGRPHLYVHSGPE